MPDALPDVATIVAIAVLLLVHVPPGNVFVSVVELPSHTLAMPPIAEGRGVMVSLKSVAQPSAVRYPIIAVPAEMPATRPVAEPTVATPVPKLLHVPPVVALLKVVAEP